MEWTWALFGARKSTHSSTCWSTDAPCAGLLGCCLLAGGLAKLLTQAHLNWVDGMVCSDLLDRHAATDRVHRDPGLELGTVGAVLAYWWEPRLGAVLRLRG